MKRNGNRSAAWWTIVLPPAAAIFAAAVGAIVLIGWITGSAPLVQVFPTFAPMQYNAAIGFLLAGVGMLATLANRRFAARTAGTLVFALGAATLLEYLTGRDLGIDQLLLHDWITVGTTHPGRIAPNTAVCFVLAGLVLVSGEGRRDSRGDGLKATLAVVVASLGTLAFAGYLTSVPAAYGWGPVNQMSVLTAIGMIALGAGIFARAWQRSTDAPGMSPGWLAGAAGLGGLTTTFCLWQSLYAIQHQRIENHVQDIAATVESRMHDGFGAYARLFDRMADRWADQDSTWQVRWADEASQIVGLSGEYVAVRWLDAAGVERTTRAMPGPVGHAGVVMLDGAAPVLLERALSVASPQLAFAGTGAAGPGVVVVAPMVNQDGAARGWITAGLRLDYAFPRLLPADIIDRFRITVREAGREIYRLDAQPDRDERWTATREVELPGTVWQVEVRPTAATVAAGHTRTDESVLVVGLALSLLFASALRFGQQAQRRAEEIAVANRVLEREMANRSVIERALRESEQRYRDLTEKSQGFIWIHDFDGRLLTVNPAAAHALGWAPEEMLGRHIREFVHEEVRPDIAEYLRHIRNHADLRGTVRMCTRTGEVRIWSFNNSRYCEGERPIWVLANAQDITQLKATEAELAQARDAAVESARLKSEFLANMSHEIRTPLNGVIGMTDLMLGTELTTEQRDYAEMTRASADSLLTIVNDILDFSKIEAGMLAFESLDFGLRNLVESTIEMFAEPAKRKKIELATLVYSDVPDALKGDPGRLRQVLTNLVGNAVKFTLAGEVTVRVIKEAETDDHALVRFSIADTGIGIAEEQQARLFQPFTQADGSTARQFGGTGLGLAISKQLVDRMEGEIGVDSEPGVGSTFWFTAQLEKQPVTAGAGDGDVDLAGLRVLIVDDNETNRTVIRHYVTSWGMRPEEAQGGSEALAMLRDAHEGKDPFDLAVMDLMMPGMTGFELARMIKGDAAIAGVRLVLMPSFGKRGHASDAREAGIAAYLVKPVRQSELHDCLIAVVSDRADPIEPPSRLVTRHSLAERSRRPRQRILIAEDNLVNQKVLMAQVSKLGYRADLVNNGEEALAALGRYPYTLVLMDCQMPRLDGYAATGEIRKREGDTRRTPIIAITANALAGEREKCKAAGMDDYLAKPVKQEDLRAIIEHWLPRDEDGALAVPEYRGDPGIIAKAADITGGLALSDQLLQNGHAGQDADSESVRQRVDELRAECGVDLLGSLIDMFVTDAETRIDTLHRLVADRDANGINESAHALKGSCLNFGADRLAGLLQRLEDCGEENRLDGTATLMTQIEAEFNAVRPFLETGVTASSARS